MWVSSCGWCAILDQIAVATSRIGRRVSRWDKLCDEYLIPIYKYLKYTVYLGVVYQVVYAKVLWLALLCLPLLRALQQSPSDIFVHEFQGV